MLETAREWVRWGKRDALAVYFATRDPRTPPVPRGLALMLGVYVISPLDLLPELVPILGDLIDVAVVPLGFIAVIHLLPSPVLESSRAQADALLAQPRSRMKLYALWAAWLVLTAAVSVWLVWR